MKNSDAADTVSENGVVIVVLYLFLALLSYALLGGATFKTREIPLARA